MSCKRVSERERKKERGRESGAGQWEWEWEVSFLLPPDSKKTRWWHAWLFLFLWLLLDFQAAVPCIHFGERERVRVWVRVRVRVGASACACTLPPSSLSAPAAVWGCGCGSDEDGLEKKRRKKNNNWIFTFDWFFFGALSSETNPGKFPAVRNSIRIWSRHIDKKTQLDWFRQRSAAFQTYLLSLFGGLGEEGGEGRTGSDHFEWLELSALANNSLLFTTNRFKAG